MTRFVTRFTGQITFVNFDIDFVNLSCLFEWSYTMSFAMTMALPFIIIAIQFIRHKLCGLEKYDCIRIVATFLVRACACAYVCV